MFTRFLSVAVLLALALGSPTPASTKASRAASPTATVIVPLYIYPSPGAWDTLYTSLSANPGLKFQVVINPASGPGAPNTYPDSNYIAAISKLRKYPNAIPLCYVHTSWATRAIPAVETDITTCRNWKNYTSADIHMSGIFFDEAVATYNTTTLAYMTSITNFARSSLGAGNNAIVFNPGMVVVSGWYSLADYIVAFENSYAAYSAAVIGWIPGSVRKQSMFIIYGFTGTATDQQNLVNGIVHTGGIGGLFITDQTVYSAWSSLWAQFASAMNLA